MRYCIIILLAAVYLIAGIPDWFSADGNVLLEALSHHFFHANVFHLCVNCISVWLVFPGKGRNAGLLPAAYIVASLSFLVSPRPVVGFSDILYSVMGFRFPLFTSRWWRSRDTVVFLVLMLLSLFIPAVSAVTHIVSFALSAVIAAVTGMIKGTLHDMRRASYR